MIRVLLVNNYSMKNAYNLWKKGLSGSHHVWGKVELDRKGHVDMIIFKHEKYKFLNSIGNAIGITHLDQQVRILFAGSTYDILFAPYSTANTKLLLVLKWLGIYKKPIVITLHQPFIGTFLKNPILKQVVRKMFLTYDAIIFLSEKLKQDSASYFGIPLDSERFFLAQWGPDTEFYKNIPIQKKVIINEPYLISAGHTARDYETLIEAFRNLNYSLKIFCTPKSLPKVENIPDNVTINADFIPYIELIGHYQESEIILVPLKYPLEREGCQGMTSLQDVVALAKPMIITRNEGLNLDPVTEGIGWEVEKGDVDGWVKTVTCLMEDENARHRMKLNSIRVYNEIFNSEIFADELEKTFERVYKKFC